MPESKSERGSEKRAFVLRLNRRLLQDLEAWAEEDFRSVNGQIEFLLSQAVATRRKTKSQQKKNSTES